MARSEFRWNKKRKHYAYLHKDIGSKRKNILISTKPYVIKRKRNINRIIQINIPLYKHPNPNKYGQFYIIPINYIDDISSFDNKIYKWNWNKNNKRKVKHIKNNKKYEK